MRLSINENDPGYSVQAHVASVKVWCDGDLIKWPITVDDETGYVEYFACWFGEKVCHEVNGELRRLRLERYGDVTIEYRTGVIDATIEYGTGVID